MHDNEFWYNPNSFTGKVTNIPPGMVTDQFGMIGLLAFIRAAETDPGMVHLALGSDLTTLGLNLNSPEYVTFPKHNFALLYFFSMYHHSWPLG